MIASGAGNWERTPGSQAFMAFMDPRIGWKTWIL